jgi:aminoglycoside phosphotransferase (APT) family kinase protein
MHADQLAVTTGSVRSLIEAQFPGWASLPVERFESEGTVNAIFRLGDRLSARFPLRPAPVDTIRRALRSEAEAAGVLAGRTRFATPRLVAFGEPGCGYPLPWSVHGWLRGRTATVADPGRSVGFARDLAEFITDVRAIATDGRSFAGAGRGGDLRSHDGWMEECLARRHGLFDVDRVQRLWQRLRDLPRCGPDLMTHGDLTPGNVLVSRGRLVGVLDVDGLGPADRALDLVAAWHLLEAGPRRVVRDLLDCGDVEWQRGKAWALEQATGAVWYYATTNPAMSRMGKRTIDRILADEPTP